MCGEHEGFTLWFTGLPCSGKSAVGDRVAEILKEKGHRVERLDGDVVRQDLTRDLGFSKKDRDENIRRVTFVAKLLSRNGVAVLMGVELILNAANINFVAFSSFFNNVNGQVFALFSIAVAAAEVAVGLAILLNLYKVRDTITLDDLNLLRW